MTHPSSDTADGASGPATLPVWRWVVLLALLASHLALLVGPAVRNSVTVDEYAHLPAGVAYWRWGEWSIYNQSPPLLRLIAAWPAVLSGADAPPATRYRDDRPQDRYWNYADAYTELNASDYHRLLVRCRLSMIGLSCAGLLLVYACAARFCGWGGGLFAAGLYALCPNVAAHGSIVGTDVGAAVFALAAVWSWIEFARRPTPLLALLAGLTLGMALLCKFSAILLVPVAMLIMGWGCLATRQPRRAILAGGAAAMIVSLVVVNLCYGYDGTFRPIGQFRLESRLMQSVAGLLPDSTPVPLPKHFVLGFDAAQWELEQPFQGYLLGRAYVGTDWRYYPVALGAKLAMGTLASMLAAAVVWVRRPPGWGHPLAPLLVGAFVVGVGTAAGATANIGVRYLLPAVVMAYVACGYAVSGSAAATGRVSRRRLAAVVAAMVLLGLEHLSVTPRPLTFFNWLAGGPIGGQQVLNDSNADWGQGLIDLRTWMRRNGVDRVQLAYFGRVNPRVYGIDFALPTEPGTTAPATAAAERWLVVSSYFRAGLSYRMPRPEGGRGDFAALPAAGLLRARPPVAVVGNVMFVYELGRGQREGSGDVRSASPSVGPLVDSIPR